MAVRRCLSMKILDSDAYLNMPLSTQMLYVHLNMRADDDGFVNNPTRIRAMIGASEDDLKLLAAKRFIIPFDNGIVVIKHWRMHNTLKNDRIKAPQYPELASKLYIKANGSYTDMPDNGGKSLLESKSGYKSQAICSENTKEIPNGIQMESMKGTEPNRTEPNRTEGEAVDSTDDSDTADEPVEISVDNRMKYLGTLGKGVVMLSGSQIDSLLEQLTLDEFNHYVSKLADFLLNHPAATVKSHYNTILKWVNEDRQN